METTYQYQITQDGAVLATGEKTLDLGVLTPNLHKSGFWGDVLHDLAEKANLAICVNGGWLHPTDSNFSPLDDEGALIDVQIGYRGGLNQHYKAMKV